MRVGWGDNKSGMCRQKSTQKDHPQSHVDSYEYTIHPSQLS